MNNDLGAAASGHTHFWHLRCTLHRCMRRSVGLFDELPLPEQVAAADSRDTASDGGLSEAPLWRLALAVTLVVLCGLIGLVLGLCGS